MLWRVWVVSAIFATLRLADYTIDRYASEEVWVSCFSEEAISAFDTQKMEMVPPVPPTVPTFLNLSLSIVTQVNTTKERCWLPVIDREGRWSSNSVYIEEAYADSAKLPFYWTRVISSIYRRHSFRKVTDQASLKWLINHSDLHDRLHRLTRLGTEASRILVHRYIKKTHNILCQIFYIACVHWWRWMLWRERKTPQTWISFCDIFDLRKICIWSSALGTIPTNSLICRHKMA